MPTDQTPIREARMQDETRRPVVAFMGEFSSGKSTLINLLLGTTYLPTQATATKMPAVILSYGSAKGWVKDLKGNRREIDYLSEVHNDSALAKAFIMSGILADNDIMDMPGISDPNLLTEAWTAAAEMADIVVWCTSATQAWRQTEAATWKSLPERLRKNSIMVVTRADKLVDEKDSAKVVRRIVRETDGAFAGPVLFAAPLVARARLTRDPEQRAMYMAGSGIETIARLIGERVSAARPAQAACESAPEGASAEADGAPVAEASVPIPFKPKSRPSPKRAEADTAATSSVEPVAGAVEASMGSANVPPELAAWRKIVTESPENPTNQQILFMIDQLLATIFDQRSRRT